jgi:hypothetical protein
MTWLMWHPAASISRVILRFKPILPIISLSPSYNLDNLCPLCLHAYMGIAYDIHAGWQAVATATVEDCSKMRNWDYWLAFCSNAQQEGPLPA